MPAPETQQPQFEQIQMGASPATPTTEQPSTQKAMIAEPMSIRGGGGGGLCCGLCAGFACFECCDMCC